MKRNVKYQYLAVLLLVLRLYDIRATYRQSVTVSLSVLHLYFIFKLYSMCSLLPCANA